METAEEEFSEWQLSCSQGSLTGSLDVWKHLLLAHLVYQNFFHLMYGKFAASLLNVSAVSCCHLAAVSRPSVSTTSRGITSNRVPHFLIKQSTF